MYEHQGEFGMNEDIGIDIYIYTIGEASLMAQMVENLPASEGDGGSIPGSRRSPGEGNSNPLKYSCLGNPMDRGTWHTTVHGVEKSQIRLSDQKNTNTIDTMYKIDD